MTVAIIGVADSDEILDGFLHKFALGGMIRGRSRYRRSDGVGFQYLIEIGHTLPDDDPHGDAFFSEPPGLRITSRWTVPEREPEPVAA